MPKPNAHPSRNRTTVPKINGEITFDVRHSYSVKGKTLQPLSVEYLGNRTPTKRVFKSASELEKVLLQFSSVLFGNRTTVVPMPKRTAALFDKADVPHFLLLEQTDDLAKPRFYLVTIALAKHASMDVLLPRLLKYLSALRDESIGGQLIEALAANKAVRKELLSSMKADDLPHYLKVALTHSTVLLVTDGDLKELPEVMGTFAGSWQSVKTVVFNKYALGKEIILSLAPAFSELHVSPRQRKQNAPVNEDYHLENVQPHVRDIYRTIKAELLAFNPALVFNAQRYYVALKAHRNVAIFQFTKNKLNIVVMHDEKETRKKIKHYEIRSLKESVQRFWGPACCTVVVGNEKYLTEVTALIKLLSKV